MSNIENPYQSPESSPMPVPELQSQGKLTENMLLYLKGASPWLRFIGIMGFIGTGFLILWGIISIAFMSIFNQLMYSSYDVIAPGAGAIVGAFSGIMMIGGSALLFFPSLFTFRFGDKIKKYMQSGAENDLEQAFKNNKSLWKFSGIVLIVYLAIIPVVLILSIIAGIAGLFWAFL